MNTSCIAIEKAFRELIMTMPYRAISVSDICAQAHLSRKSFYVNFHNKEDVVSKILFDDVVKPIRDINTLFTINQNKSMTLVIYEKVYERIYQNPEFYRALVTPMKGHDDTFIRILTHHIYEFNAELLAKRNSDRSDFERDYTSYFFASSQAMLIQKWIADGFPCTPKELAQLYDKMTKSYWLSTYGESRGNNEKHQKL